MSTKPSSQEASRSEPDSEAGRVSTQRLQQLLWAVGGAPFARGSASGITQPWWRARLPVACKQFAFPSSVRPAKPPLPGQPIHDAGSGRRLPLRVASARVVHVEIAQLSLPTRHARRCARLTCGTRAARDRRAPAHQDRLIQDGGSCLGELNLAREVRYATPPPSPPSSACSKCMQSLHLCVRCALPGSL